MGYGAGAIANEFLDLAEGEGEALDAMKLQKLVYLAHGYHLAITGSPLIDEFVEAWRFGPVIPSLYHQFKSFGASPIAARAKGYEPHQGAGRFVECTLEQFPQQNHEFTRKLIRRVWGTYGPLTGVQLSNLTHQPGTPWHDTMEKAKREGRVLKGLDIEPELIRSHFIQLLNA